MPARVHALVVVRADSEPAARHLESTLGALRTQQRPADEVTVVVCGRSDGALAQVLDQAAEVEVITAPRSTGFADAAALAIARATEADALWILAQDTVPAPDALALLSGGLELSASAALAAPKVVDAADADRIVSLGVTVTTLGRTVELAADELDQGQNDGRLDVLASDLRGALIRRRAWEQIDGADPALVGADEGLDVGVRARLAGWRVALVPAARLRVWGDGVIGLPGDRDDSTRRRRAYLGRAAQLHRRLAYAHPVLVALHWLSLPFLAVVRTVLHLVRKMPALVLPEWRATARTWVRIPSIVRARRRIRTAPKRGADRVPWSRLAPLRISGSQLRRRLGRADEPASVPQRHSIRFFSGGGAWTVLGALVVGVFAFIALLAWPALGGGALLPLRDSLFGLWSDAAYGQRALGLESIGPADPFAIVIALLGTLTPWNPSQALVILWVLALPLAALAGWFGAARVTDRSGLRIAAAVLWALAPTFWTALIDGRPAAVIVHLLLPWLFSAAAVARRSWGAAAVASLLLAGVVACAPVLGLPLGVLWVASCVTARAGVARTVWVAIPALAVWAPLLWTRGVRRGEWWSLVADPGFVVPAAQAAPDAAGRLLLATGFPTPARAGWEGLLAGADATALLPWVALLFAPTVLLAIVALASPRWAVSLWLWGIMLLGIATAMLAVGVSVQASADVPVALWPGAALSVAWLGLVGAAVVGADAPAPRAQATSKVVVLIAACVAVGVAAVPAVSATVRGEAVLTNGPTSTLPAYVGATATQAGSTATLVITPLGADALTSEVVWGASETLGGQSTDRSTRLELSAGDREAAELAAQLISPANEGAEAALAPRGIAFVFLRHAPEVAGEPLERAAAAALDTRAGVERVGDTGSGQLWRVSADAEPRPRLDAGAQALRWSIAGIQLAVALIAILLAVPTAASRRAAWREPRVVGGITADEITTRGRPLPAGDTGRSAGIDVAEPVPEETDDPVQGIDDHREEEPR